MNLGFNLRTHTTLFACLFMFTSLSGQKDMRKADKQFELKSYELSIENYKIQLEKDADCIHCTYQIAESYRLLNQNLDAAIWYRKLEGVAELPQSYYMNYGKVMKKMGQYNKAEELFASYASVDPITSNYLILSCGYAKDLLREEPKYDISLYPVSSSAADYGPAVFNDKIMFSSFRNDFIRANNKVNESVINTQGAQLFVAPLGNEARKNQVSHLRNDLEEDYQIVSICYSNSYSQCAITKSQVQHASLAYNEEDSEMGIYMASVDASGNFYNIIPFPHNEVGYSTAFATLNAAGNIMYFSSNRPGGMGGYDIYASFFKNGMWTYPDNLGATINTPGNEITPSFDGDNLFFASDYHFGLGGYDMFKSKVEDGEWINPENLGNGVNSPEDDLFGIQHPSTKDYYISSNRLGGKGNHDIYIVTDISTPDDNLISAIDEEVAPSAVSLPTIKDNGPALNNAATVAEKAVTTTIDTKTAVAEEDLSKYSDDNPPPAVVLSEVQPRNTKIKETTIAKPTSTNTTVKTTANTAKFGSAGVSMAMAKKVSVGEKITTGKPMYFIQLAAFFKSEANVVDFSNLSEYGNLYKIKESNATKVKLGYYYDEYEAKRILSLVRNKGYKDAFISLTAIDTRNMELVVTSGDNFTYERGTTTTPVTSYKVRLASYSDASWFELGTVDDLGTIEQWTKGDWTIFVLSGYSNWENAETARIKAANRGYVDATVVMDNNGVLEAIKSN